MPVSPTLGKRCACLPYEPTLADDRQSSVVRRAALGVVGQCRPASRLIEDELELTSGLLSRGASFRLIVSGRVGAREIERLIKKLELVQARSVPPEAASESDPYGVGAPLCLAAIDGFDVVAIGVEHKGSVVARMVRPFARGSVVRPSRLETRNIEAIDGVTVLGLECDVLAAGQLAGGLAAGGRRDE